MTREEAITVLENIKMDLEHYRDLFMYSNDINSVIERLKQPPTLAEFLGLEEGQEYNWKGTTIKIGKNNIYEKNEQCSSNWCNFYVSGEELLDLRQAKKVEVE